MKLDKKKRTTLVKVIIAMSSVGIVQLFLAIIVGTYVDDKLSATALSILIAVIALPFYRHGWNLN
ncbi:hypothetical protein [Apilactobacillus xinyiensis]|uniref:Uncharacterized protein n=1 Tax=Apilactobacillus xinyiensis TaxID=2841032 RepID=A0ABT0I2C6_9LACO|nr:hypothetical protein [Apilactobacillus xinyiensis]MCK8624885.1 hypothetical protein [Apilactobacillus xinyiensis]MCL0319352.1 hypothetical protein [Apilactobacillus xinyiensis]MCL0329752.1 hypothetical protein [Apilactobacillus xinyiensis]